MRNQLTYILAGFLLVGIFSCSSCGGLSEAEKELKQLIRQHAREDKTVSAEEFQEIQEATQGTPQEGASEDELLEYIRGVLPRIDLDIDTRPPFVQPKVASAYNVYVENSGSMYGYMEGYSEFKQALLDLLTRFNEKDEDFDLFLINDRTFSFGDISKQSEEDSRSTPVGQQLDYFVNFLEKDKLRKFGNTSNSEINNIFSIVAEKMKSSGRGTVLVSDYIYSIGKNDDMQESLARQEATTKTVFQDLKDDYGVLILKMESDFNGNYYSYQNRPIKVKKSKRPYYIWIFNKKSVIRDFYERYSTGTLKGYKSRCLIYDSGDDGDDIEYSILPKTGKEGRFKFMDRQQGKNSYAAIQDVKKGEGDRLSFSVAMDLSDLDLPTRYLLTPDNWKLTANEFDYEILEISTIDEANKDDRQYFGSSTHFVTLATNDMVSEKDKLKLSLRKQLPDWVSSSSTLDDTSIDAIEGKTFGFAQLADAAFKGFNGHKEENFYLTIKLTVAE